MNLGALLELQAWCNPETAEAHGTKCGKPTKESGTLEKRTARAKGFTYSVVHHTSPRKGFALSISKNNEHVIDGKPKANHIAAYIRNHRKDLMSDPRMHVGGWFDSKSKKTYLDVSLIEKDKKKAFMLAQKHKQLAIFDLEHKQVLTTPKKKIELNAESKTRNYFAFRHTANPDDIEKEIGKLS